MRQELNDFRSQPFEAYNTVLKGISTVWCMVIFLGEPRAKLFYHMIRIWDYSHHFLRQFLSESQGSALIAMGNPINYPTGMVIFGSAGTDAQHSLSSVASSNPEQTVIPNGFYLVF